MRLYGHFYLLFHGFQVEGFQQQTVHYSGAVQQILDLFFSVAGHDDHPGPEMPLFDLIGQLISVDEGHVIVGQD